MYNINSTFTTGNIYERNPRYLSSGTLNQFSLKNFSKILFCLSSPVSLAELSHIFPVWSQTSLRYSSISWNHLSALTEARWIHCRAQPLLVGSTAQASFFSHSVQASVHMQNDPVLIQCNGMSQGDPNVTVLEIGDVDLTRGWYRGVALYNQLITWQTVPTSPDFFVFEWRSITNPRSCPTTSLFSKMGNVGCEDDDAVGRKWVAFKAFDAHSWMQRTSAECTLL